jgi:hypothetical protein
MAGPKRPVRNYWGAGQFGGRLRVVGQKDVARGVSARFLDFCELIPCA